MMNLFKQKMKMNIITRIFLGIIFLFNFYSFLHAQEIRSQKSTILINNLKVEEEIIPDTTPPLIKIISPLLEEDEISTNDAELTVIGKITDAKSGINRVFINSESFSLLFMAILLVIMLCSLEPVKYCKAEP